MARKTKVLTLSPYFEDVKKIITDEDGENIQVVESVKKDHGRDTGKRFVVTEMSARKAHNWASRVVFAMLSAGVEIPDDIADSGMAAIASIGINAIGKIPPAIAIPLMDELLECVEVMPNPDNQSITLKLTESTIDGNIEEPLTLFKLQKEALLIHLDFSTPANP